MPKRLVASLLCLLLTALRAQAQTQTDRDIAAVIQARVDSSRNPGIVVGILGHGAARIVAAGFADEARTVPVDGNTVFEIGSVSKVFTGALLADMVRRGEVRLDDPVQKFLPASVRMPARNGREITLLDLSTHRSGLPRLPSNLAPADPTNPYADYSVEKLYGFLSGYTLTRDVGSMYEYSNLGIGLLGHVLALRAGRSYEALLVERILAPLGMRDTRITLTPAMRKRMATGHYETGYAAPAWDLPALAGAGAIRSTVNDMLKFVAANLDSASTPLGPTLHAAQVVQRTGPGTAPPVGLGWHLNRYKGRDIIWHNGGTGGFHSYVALDHGANIGVVVLSNSSTSIDGIGLWLLDSSATVSTMSRRLLRREIPTTPAQLESLPGTYDLTRDFALTVSRRGDSLFVTATGQMPVRLSAESPTRFFLRPVDAQLEFEADSSGRATALVLHQNGAKQRARRRQ